MPPATMTADEFLKQLRQAQAAKPSTSAARPHDTPQVGRVSPPGKVFVHPVRTPVATTKIAALSDDAVDPDAGRSVGHDTPDDDAEDEDDTEVDALALLAAADRGCRVCEGQGYTLETVKGAWGRTWRKPCECTRGKQLKHVAASPYVLETFEDREELERHVRGEATDLQKALKVAEVKEQKRLRREAAAPIPAEEEQGDEYGSRLERARQEVAAAPVKAPALHVHRSGAGLFADATFGRTRKVEAYEPIPEDPAELERLANGVTVVTTPAPNGHVTEPEPEPDVVSEAARPGSKACTGPAAIVADAMSEVKVVPEGTVTTEPTSSDRRERKHVTKSGSKPPKWERVAAWCMEHPTPDGIHDLREVYYQVIDPSSVGAKRSAGISNLYMALVQRDEVFEFVKGVGRSFRFLGLPSATPAVEPVEHVSGETPVGSASEATFNRESTVDDADGNETWLLAHGAYDRLKYIDNLVSKRRADVSGANRWVQVLHWCRHHKATGVDGAFVTDKVLGDMYLKSGSTTNRSMWITQMRSAIRLKTAWFEPVDDGFRQFRLRNGLASLRVELIAAHDSEGAVTDPDLLQNVNQKTHSASDVADPTSEGSDADGDVATELDLWLAQGRVLQARAQARLTQAEEALKAAQVKVETLRTGVARVSQVVASRMSGASAGGTIPTASDSGQAHTSNRDRVIKLLRSNRRTIFCADDVGRALQMDRALVQTQLGRLQREGVAERVIRGYYRYYA